MGRKGKEIVWSTVLAGLFLGMLLLIFLPKKGYSEQENRYLADFPVFSVKSVTDASFMKGLETYLCDHFPFRDWFMSVRTWKERLSGKNQVNGIYLCEDGFYIEQYKEPTGTERIISAFTRLAERVEQADILYLLVPTAVTVYADKLPKYSINASQTDEIARIYAALTAEGMPAVQTLDVTEALIDAKDEKPLYYRLDHHWTTYGAYIAYVEYCRAKGFVPYPREYFTETVVSTEFQGTVYSKLNDYLAGSDAITVFAQNDARLTVTYEDTGEVTDTLYAEKYLQEKDKYSYFLNNIHPLITIENAAVSSGRALVVVKDSYANCFVPFLVNHYDTVYVVDTRYFKESVSAFINGHPEVTDVLVLYNMNTIDGDLGIGGIY